MKRHPLASRRRQEKTSNWITSNWMTILAAFVFVILLFLVSIVQEVTKVDSGIAWGMVLIPLGVIAMIVYAPSGFVKWRKRKREEALREEANEKRDERRGELLERMKNWKNYQKYQQEWQEEENREELEHSPAWPSRPGPGAYLNLAGDKKKNEKTARN
jgi:uncharacterized integral membrane protein